MAVTFDSLAKEMLDALLHDLGRFEREVEVPALTPQRADAFFCPDPARDVERRALGVLGRITAIAVLLEAFHDAPSLADVLACLRKLLNHRHAELLARRTPAERTWLLCAGRPDAALRALRAEPAPGWPRGVYHLSEGLPLSIVVLSELDDTDDTLPLRLMGSGATLSSALRALRTRYGSLPRGRVLFAEVVQVFLAARKRGERLSEALMVDLTEAYEYMRQQHEEGMREGTLRLLPAIVRVLESRLARAVTAAERAALLTRLDADGAEGVGEALVTLDAARLVAWLGAPVRER